MPTTPRLPEQRTKICLALLVFDTALRSMLSMLLWGETCWPSRLRLFPTKDGDVEWSPYQWIFPTIIGSRNRIAN
jgi:hypothetical protein